MEIEETEIIRQLGRIAKNAIFQRSPKICQLLTYLINEELEGRGNKLKGYKVGIEGLGKNADFDPSTDASVRVETGRLRRMLSEYYAESEQDLVLIEIPKGSYQPVFTVRSRRNSSRDFESSTPAIDPSAGTSIAVVQFETTTDDKWENIFSVSLCSELFAEFFRFREFHYLDVSSLANQENQSIEQMCKEQLAADFLLRGRVTHVDQLITTTVSVTDLQSNRVMWVDRQEKQVKETNLVESARDVAFNMVHKLVRPGGIIMTRAYHKRQYANPADWSAADCILRWHHYRFIDRSPENHRELRKQTKRVLESDPMFSLGWSICAMLKLDEVAYAINPKGNIDTSLERARYLTKQAISLDPEDCWAHYLNAQCEYFSDNVGGFAQSAATALRLNPRNTDLLHQLGMLHCLSGNIEHGKELMDQAGMRQNTGPGYRLGQILVEYCWGEPLQAKQLFESGMIPNQLAMGQLAGCLAYLACDEVELAAERFRKAHELKGMQEASLKSLVELWIKDASLKDKIYQDLARLEGKTGVVTKLR